MLHMRLQYRATTCMPQVWHNCHDVQVDENMHVPHDHIVTASLAKKFLMIDVLECNAMLLLCRAALGMYDLELAYMVVAHSQLDPGEYLLELQGFAKHSSRPVRQHAIDMHLRRYSQAVRNLLEAGDEHFEDAVQLAQEHVRALHLPLFSILGFEVGEATAAAPKLVFQSS